jgi:succinate dehydrogenase / fumarate reductase membrane anchor subunit
MRLFQLQRISAIALLFFLTIHMMVLHYPPFHIDFARILERMADPLWKALDIAFLFFVLIHALSGTYAVLTDFDSVSRARKVLAGGASVIGVVAFFYGAATILAFQPPV